MRDRALQFAHVAGPRVGAQRGGGVVGELAIAEKMAGEHEHVVVALAQRPGTAMSATSTR